jgi:hypothetical protein
LLKRLDSQSLSVNTPTLVGMRNDIKNDPSNKRKSVIGAGTEREEKNTNINGTISYKSAYFKK